MADHNERGHLGEIKAAEYLEQQGYIILERNWRLGRWEVDLICSWKNILVIVEVKTRYSPEERPEELLNFKKKRNLRLAADAYIRMRELNMEVRFDLVLVEGEELKIKHIPDAIQLFDC